LPYFVFCTVRRAAFVAWRAPATPPLGVEEALAAARRSHRHRRDEEQECQQLGCTELLSLPVEDYALLRADATLFLVLPGHEEPEHETVVVDAGSYLIVRTKPAIGEPVAAATL
jgi:hypothetical protein